MTNVIPLHPTTASPFVELAPGVSVDPAEVDVVAGTTTSSQVFLRGGNGAYIRVDRPLYDVLRVLASAPGATA